MPSRAPKGDVCILCDQPAEGFGMTVVDVNGPDQLGIGLCTRCTANTRGFYSEADSDLIHARYKANPYRYAAGLVRAGKLQ